MYLNMQSAVFRYFFEKFNDALFDLKRHFFLQILCQMGLWQLILLIYGSMNLFIHLQLIFTSKCCGLVRNFSNGEKYRMSGVFVHLNSH